MSEGNGLPTGWVEASVGDLGEFINGFAFKPTDWGEEGLPIIRIQNLTDAEKPLNRTLREVPDKYRVESGDLLVSWSATLDAFIWGREPALLNQHIFKIVLNSRIAEKRFSFYLLRFAIEQMSRTEHLHGSTMKHINRGPFLAHTVGIPSLPHQRRVAEALDELFSDLDAGVASLQRAKANLKRYRASVLKSAVEGRLTEEWRKEHPQAEDGSMLLDRILRERREKWERDQLLKFKEKGKEPSKNWQSKYEEPSAPDTSELPELPEGWAWATVEQLVALVTTGATPSRTNSAFWDGGTIPWVTSSVVNEDTVTHAEEFITEMALEETNTKLFPPGTLLVALYGEGKTRGKVTELCISATTNQACASLLFDESEACFRSFIKLFFRHNYDSMRRLSAGGVQPNLSVSLIRELPIPLPPLAEQEQIVALVEERLSQIDSAEKTIDAELIRSKRLRQSILKRAFEGKLVPQDPKDEPASVLLERIKASREAEQPKKKAKKVKAK